MCLARLAKAAGILAEDFGKQFSLFLVFVAAPDRGRRFSLLRR
jgi:hypothetical protein